MGQLAFAVYLPGDVQLAFPRRSRVDDTIRIVANLHSSRAGQAEGEIGHGQNRMIIGRWLASRTIEL